MAGTWFDRHERFGDCKWNEVYIGCGVFAEFYDKQIIRLRRTDGCGIYIDSGSVSILAGALKEWEGKQR